MRLIIAGSRGITDRRRVEKAFLRYGFHKRATAIVSGGAAGVDQIGEWLAGKYGLDLIRMPADWETYGKRAGPIRNAKMAGVSDALLAIWDFQSRGTLDMIGKAVIVGLKVYLG